MVNVFQFAGLLMIPLGGVFGALLWIMVYMQSYMHFPKIGKNRRILMSIGNATLVTLMVLAVCYIMLVFLAKNIIG